MQANSPAEFYERIVEGTDYKKTITIEHSSGHQLEGVEMHPVSKRVLASVIERLPDEMFEAVDEAENPDEAEEELEDRGMSTEALTESTVAAFEDLCKESFQHPELTNTQMEQIVEHLGFAQLFELGSEIIEMSFENSGDIQDFHEHD